MKAVVQTMDIVVSVNSDNFDEYIKMRDEVQNLLNAAYARANFFMKTIENEKEWSGEAYKKFHVYMELITQYQKLFSDSDEDNPLQISREADMNFRNAVANFKDNFPEYKALEELA